MRKSTHENLIEYAFKPFTRQLIKMAHQKSDIAYSEMDRYLEKKCGFSRLYRNATGFLAGTLMDAMWYGLEKDVPLLNMLLVRVNDRVAGPGAGPYMAKWFSKPKFKNYDARKKHWREWRQYCAQGRREVYAFKKWDKIYDQMRDSGWLDEPLRK